MEKTKAYAESVVMYSMMPIAGLTGIDIVSILTILLPMILECLNFNDVAELRAYLNSNDRGFRRQYFDVLSQNLARRAGHKAGKRLDREQAKGIVESLVLHTMAAGDDEVGEVMAECMGA